MAKTRNLGDLLRQWMADDPELASAVEREAINSHIARQIHGHRTDVGLTQTELAKRAGTHQSVIARMEDADYEGHSVAMLKRIADSLDCSLSVEFRKKVDSTGVKAGEYVQQFESVTDWPGTAPSSTQTRSTSTTKSRSVILPLHTPIAS